MLDPTKLAAIDDDVAELFVQIDTRQDVQGLTLVDHGRRLDTLEGAQPPDPEPEPVIPPVPTAAEISVSVVGDEVFASVLSPTATMARFDVDPGTTIEEAGLSHVRALTPGDYAMQVAVGNAAGWSEQSTGVPFTITADAPPPATWTDRVTPTSLSAPFSTPAIAYTRWHDTPPDTTALALFGDDWEAEFLRFERVGQAIFWNRRGTVRDVDIWNFGRTASNAQQHGVYGRGGLVERVRVHSVDPAAANGASAFHAHREDGPITDLIWRNCENHSGTDAIMAGYVAVGDGSWIDGFIQSRNKLRVGVVDAHNGEVWMDRILADVLQLDGASFSPGTRLNGQARVVVTRGGLPMSIDQVHDTWPSINLDGFTIGPIAA